VALETEQQDEWEVENMNSKLEMQNPDSNSVEELQLGEGIAGRMGRNAMAGLLLMGYKWSQK
jgi:hypothetical protein